MRFVQLIAVWLLVLALPLQALAAYTPSARCSESHAAPVTQAAGDGQHSHHGDASHLHEHPADHQQPDSNPPADQAGGYSCCHHVFSGAPSVTIAGAPAAPHAVTMRVMLLSTLHIPELPQRPPRA
jgi:hypothetical protein